MILCLCEWLPIILTACFPNLTSFVPASDALETDTGTADKQDY